MWWSLLVVLVAATVPKEFDHCAPAFSASTHSEWETWAGVSVILASVVVHWSILALGVPITYIATIHVMRAEQEVEIQALRCSYIARCHKEVENEWRQVELFVSSVWHWDFSLLTTDKSGFYQTHPWCLSQLRRIWVLDFDPRMPQVWMHMARDFYSVWPMCVFGMIGLWLWNHRSKKWEK